MLLTTGKTPEPLRLVAPGPHVHIADWVPQAAVLRHASVVVCHGGSGTTLGALAAGVPLVVTPLFADQPYNAARVAALGAGVAVEPGPDLGARCSTAVASVLGDEDIRVAALGVAREIAALPTVDDVVAGFPNAFGA